MIYFSFRDPATKKFRKPTDDEIMAELRKREAEINPPREARYAIEQPIPIDEKLLAYRMAHASHISRKIRERKLGAGLAKLTNPEPRSGWGVAILIGLAFWLAVAVGLARVRGWL